MTGPAGIVEGHAGSGGPTMGPRGERQSDPVASGDDESGGAALQSDGPPGAPLAAGGTEVAIAALALSVLWLFFVGSVLGLTLGILARRRLAYERRRPDHEPPHWAEQVAAAAVVIGGIETAVAVVLASLQVLGVVDITAACHPVVTGVHCHLAFR